MRPYFLCESLIILLFFLFTALPHIQAQEISVEYIIQSAGNTEDEKERYRLLIDLTKRDYLDAYLRNDLEMLLPFIDAWANGRENAVQVELDAPFERRYLLRSFHKKVSPDNDFPGNISEKSPLYPVWCFYRARFLIWQTIEIPTYDNVEEYYREAISLLKIAQKAFPQNRIIGMYLGEPIPWKASFPHDPRAPRWANLQREAIEKLTYIIHWWIDNRQLPDGQFGGGWDDDVEMRRWWSPIILAFKDTKVIDAQMKLALGMMRQPHMEHGYTDNMNDVQHSAEDLSDVLTPAAHIAMIRPDYKGPVFKFVNNLMDMVRTQWTGKNKRNFLQFKSVYFNVHEVSLDPVHSYDTVYHSRVVEPALIYWEYTGDKELTDFFTSWLDTWTDIASREENGKPAGILPSAIHWPEGQVGLLGKDWYKPEIYPGDLYAWPSGGMVYMTKVLLLTYYMTDNEKYLEPILSMLRMRLHYWENPPEKDPEPGNTAWCATMGGVFNNGMASFLPETVVKLRALIDYDGYDHILMQSNINGYKKFRISGDFGEVEQELETLAQAFNINKASYTSEVRYTDRVLRFSRDWYNNANSWSFPVPNAYLLYSTLTGDPGAPTYFPMNAVRWLTEPREFAALVTTSRTTEFKAKLYHFGDYVRVMGANLHFLKPGNYKMTLTDISDKKEKILSTQDLSIKGRISRISFRLWPRTLCRLHIEKTD